MAVDICPTLILPMEIDMQTEAFPSLQSRYRGFDMNMPNHPSPTGYFESHPVGEIIRSFFFSSILWMLLAITLYGVYSMVVAS
jgi:hypothetical protein